MNNEILLKVLGSLEDKILNKDIKIDKGNFIEIKKQYSGNKIVFVDGGQAELLKAVDFSLQFIRVVALIFKNNKKIDLVINEFFVLISVEADKEGIKYTTEIFKLKEDATAINNISLNSLEPSIREGNERADISKIGGIVRRFAELKLAENLIEKLGKNDILLLDGSLKCMVKGEHENMQSLFAKADSLGIIVASLAKTTRLLSENGVDILSQLNQSAEKNKRWHYHFDNKEDYAVYAVKLSKNSSHVFEFNIFDKQKE